MTLYVAQAKWCRKCVVLKPKVGRLHDEEFPDIPFVYIDVNETPYAVMQQYGIEAMPTLVLVEGGQVVGKMKGGEDVKAVVDSLRKLMGEKFGVAAAGGK